MSQINNKKGTCLIEIGTEELPPKALKKLSNAFADGIKNSLKEAGLSFEEAKIFATPKRLALSLQGVVLQQADQTVEKRGPAKKAAYDADGNVTRAAQGFASSCGVAVTDLIERDTPKGAWLFFEANVKGQSLAQLLPEMVTQSLNKLPIPKRMRWGDRSEEFVRPVHQVVMMIDDTVVDATVLGIKSGNQTVGHRFHAPESITLQHADDYHDALSGAYVVADFDERKAIIKQQVSDMAQQLGGQAHIENELLEEVTGLVEWPKAISGKFEEIYLEVPSEALVATMQDNQKYFSVFDDKGQLMPYFITVANIDSSNPAMVSQGNERVIRPRFADARFFWHQDQKVTLASRLEQLGSVVFQKDLGSVADKVARIKELALFIAPQINANDADVAQAAELCKCDLNTEMVGEFAKMQGIAGRYYANIEGYDADVSNAIEQHYWPKFAGDKLPEARVAQCVAIADRIDTLMGIFSIGLKPTGVKDPFALRRASLAVVRILIEGKLNLNVQELCQKAAQLLPKLKSIESDPIEDEKAAQLLPKLKSIESDPIEDVVSYMFDRLKAYYADQGIQYSAVQAVLATSPSHLNDLDSRVKAVTLFQSNEAALALAAANKRITNILKKQQDAVSAEVNETLLSDEAEQLLFQQVKQLEQQVSTQVAANDYSAALSLLAKLKDPVDAFFDNVMVMCDDPAQRANRLSLLQLLSQQFMQIADISKLSK